MKSQSTGKVSTRFYEMCTAIVLVSSVTLVTPTYARKTGDSSMSLNPTPMNDPFIWVNYGEEQDYPGYSRVFGGTHADGTKMYVCRYGRIPGKLNQNKCHIPWNGKEWTYTDSFKVLLTNTQYHWKPIFQVSGAEIESHAIRGGADVGNNNAPLFICRRHLTDGTHLGKYLPVNGICYIPWGGHELNVKISEGFDVLFP